jgi:hypothetical protein
MLIASNRITLNAYAARARDTAAVLRLAGAALACG